MDLMEISALSESPTNNIDTSIMLNFERKINGASDEWLNGGDLSQQKN